MNYRETLVSKILEAAIKVDSMPVSEKDAWLTSGRDGLIVPRLPTHRHGTLHTTVDGQQALDALVDDFMDKTSFPEDIVRLNVDAAVRKACGELISQVVLEGKTAEAVTEMVEAYVFARTLAASRTLIHYVPCVLCDDNETETPFDIGPISFVPRPQFENSLTTGKKAAPWSVLAGFGKPDEELTGTGWATLQSALAGSNWVAWSRDTDTDYERSRENTLVNVELAIYCLQLAFDHNSLRTVRHKWERRPSPMNQRLFHFEGDHRLFKMQVLSETGVEAVNGFSQLVRAKHAFFASAGARISSVTSSGVHTQCPNISERWLTALFWFGKSLRESLDTAAIIALGASLDIFGRSSGKVHQMFLFCSGLLKMKDDDLVYGSTLTLKRMVELVYSDGRSQLIHGGKAMLKSDYVEMRHLSEAFVRLVLVRALERVDDYAGLRMKNAQVRDSFDDFVKFVISGRPV